jgi:hypothetical protein
MITKYIYINYNSSTLSTFISDKLSVLFSILASESSGVGILDSPFLSL